MEGRPWLFRQSLILFDRLTQSVERSQICLNSSPVWLKIGDSENGMIEDIINGEVNNLKEVIHGRSQVSEEEKMLKNQVDVATVMIDEKMVDNRSSLVINSNSAKKMSWKRIVPGQKGTQRADESGIKKRKATERRLEIFNIEDEYRDGTKRQKKEQQKDLGETHIDVTVKEDNDNREWRFTGFYGSPYVKDKEESWNLLRKLGRDQRHPWLVSGDFNEIMYSFEKK
ncbi:hypothetical protein Goari_023001 [Gossypium aridum]|uniref:Reverse transcriptase n=1 Tax=Gossypium aridum TaxID=34290 RepID=A0A7J8YQI6_GOSAI|nr:hypothetical protein [Gossypium aridum]